MKYGQESFSLAILEYTDSVLLNSFQMFWISLLKPYYNIHPVFTGQRPKYPGGDTAKWIKEEDILSEIILIKNNAYIRKAIFVYKNGVFLQRYDGISLCAKDL